jgi:hypothetical protein
MRVLIELILFGVGVVGLILFVYKIYMDGLAQRRATKEVRFTGGPLDGTKRNVTKPPKLIVEGNDVYKNAGNDVYVHQGEWV